MLAERIGEARQAAAAEHSPALARPLVRQGGELSAAPPEAPGAPLPVPSGARLVLLIRQQPGLCLRELAEALWPVLTWTQAAGVERPWPGGGHATAARWLADRLADLVIIGAVYHGPRRRTEPLLAGLVYFPAAIVAGGAP